jgi:hypothetical protein
MISYHEFVLKKLFREHLRRKFGDPDTVSSETLESEQVDFFTKDYKREYELYLRSFEVPSQKRHARTVAGPTIQDWHGKDIEIARGKGGKLSVCDYRDYIIIPEDAPWPHPDIVKKLYRSDQNQVFRESERLRLSSVLGFCCDLQSLRSEDAITWSVFGTLHYFAPSQQCLFLNSILNLLGITAKVGKCAIQLWPRIAHPDTLVSGGPELDALLIGDHAVIFVEGKWSSETVKSQGKNKEKSQLQLRREFLELYGPRIFPGIHETIILVIDNLPGKIQSHESLCYHLTWEQICNINTHPLHSEITSYYYWKKKVGV